MASDLWRIAVRASLGAGTWPDEAIKVALALLSAGDERPEVLEVAIMTPGVSCANARDAVEALLTSEGVPVVGPDDASAARLRLIAGAFVQGGVSADEFKVSWYSQLLPHDLQSEEQTLVILALEPAPVLRTR